MKPFDARCEECGMVRIIWLPWTEKYEPEPSETVKYPHDDPGCTGYGEHTLLASLDGLSDVDRYGVETTS